MGQGMGGDRGVKMNAKLRTHTFMGKGMGDAEQ